MKRFCVAFTRAQEQEDAFNEVSQQLDKQKACPKLIIFNTTGDYFWFFSTNLKKKYSDATIIGCTSSDNFSSSGYDKTGAGVMAIYSGVDVASGILFEIHRHPRNYMVHLKRAISHFSSFENTCCLEFMNSFSKGEELVLDTFASEFESRGIPVIGCSAGTPDLTKPTLVSLDGIVYQDSCVFVLIKNLNGSIHTYKENIFKKMGISIVPTDVDCDERIIYEFDDKPAADVLSDVLDVPLEKLTDTLSIHPVGKMNSGDLQVTKLGEVHKDGSIFCYSQVYNHTKLELLELDDVPEIWNKTLTELKGLKKKDSFMIGVNCASRAQILKQKNLYDIFYKNLTLISSNFLGVSGYGEQINTENLNQSMLYLIFD
jgi:hypothetical protein